MSDAVRLTRLPNGLTVVSEHMPRVETVSFGAYVAAGTRNERAEENGVSHFLEHMAFKGTERRDAADRGASIQKGAEKASAHGLVNAGPTPKGRRTNRCPSLKQRG